MSNSSRKNKTESNGINTKWVLLTLISVVLMVVVFYFVNFNSHLLKDHTWWNVYQNLSKDTGAWGTLGDYVGGILNPVIAAFAFYLIAKTYELQKRELESTRSLLKVSTDAQKDQIKLAALTALLNLNLTRIGVLESEKASLLNGKIPDTKNPGNQSNEDSPEFSNGLRKVLEGQSPVTKKEYRIQDIDNEITDLTTKNNGLMEQIENILEQQFR